jgi:hypothetical protein
MSIPPNPLNAFNATTVRHMLVAFKYTEDAEKTLITNTLGNPGETFVGSGCKGPGIVIVNEFNMSDFTVNMVRWTWDFYGPRTSTVGSCVGIIEIADRTGMHFVNFMRTKVCSVLDVSEGHIVFALRTFFIGQSLFPNGDGMLVGQPLIFNLTTLITDLSPKSGRFYSMSFVGASTTFAQLTPYSSISQMTVTHADGNLHKEIPQPTVAVSGLKTRKQENDLQSKARTNRLNKSKPMRTLREVFSAFETELNQQKFTHAAQLQSWLQKVNDDYAVKIIPPIQKKKGQLPVDFVIHLDSAYNSYEVDNRNLPFEQPEQDQLKSGIRSISLKNSKNIFEAIERLMKLSQKVGQDAELSLPYFFKVAISTIKTVANRYEIHVVIKRITVPVNTNAVNTGPGAGAVAPLEFVFQDPQYDDRDIIALVGKTTTDTAANVLEVQTQTSNSRVVYGDREAITIERAPNIDYFKSQFSGLRLPVNPEINGGLENAVNAARIDDCMNINIRQQSSISITINGNPNLLSDLNRLPSDVAKGKVGSANYYKFPELEPMYVKLKIYMKPQASLGLQTNQKVDDVFYFQNYHHLFRITNSFVSGLFLQELELLRADGSI